jgi:hypothetical protein
MRDWWLSFAIDLDPNKQSWLNIPTGGKPNWPLYGDAGSTLVVNETSIGVAVDAEMSAKCDFWQDQSDIVRNRKAMIVPELS